VRAPETLEFDRSHPGDYGAIGRDFGIRNRTQVRASTHFVLRTVTPGVAGSSPVHSAKFLLQIKDLDARWVSILLEYAPDSLEFDCRALAFGINDLAPLNTGRRIPKSEVRRPRVSAVIISFGSFGAGWAARRTVSS
jgi:hypothetical protein